MKKIHNEIVRDLTGQTVGKIRIKQPVEHTQHYECAAWYQNSVSGLGVFDLKLVEDYHSPHDIYLVASLPATITTNYFQSLWGGVAIGKSYDIRRDTGNEAPPIARRISVLEAVLNTGVTPDGKEFDVFVDPEYWSDFIVHYRAELDKAVKYAQSCTEVFQQTGDGGEFRSNLTQMGYACEQVKKLTKTIDELERKRGYQAQKSPMWRDLLRQNTTWTRDERCS